MPDQTAVAVITARPGSTDKVRAALLALVEPTRAEPGCLRYELFVSGMDPDTFITVEEWRSPADLEAHLQTDHVHQALALAGEFLAAPPAIHPLRPVG